MKKFLSLIIVLALLGGGIFYYTNKTPRLEGEVRVHHPYWKGSIIPLEKDRAQRKGHSDTGRVQNVTSDSFEMVWDKWDIEIFKKNPKTGIYNLAGKKPKNQPTAK